MAYMQALPERVQWPQEDFERSLVFPLYGEVVPGPTQEKLPADTGPMRGPQVK